MWTQFYLENAHFAISLITALVMFAVFWLYFDAWLIRKTARETFKISGFLVLAISYIIYASYVETSVIQGAILSEDIYRILLSTTRIGGYILLIIGLVLDPLQPRPKIRIAKAFLVFPFGISVTSHVISSTAFLYPLLCSICAFLYLRRATVGLENHIKPVTFAFFLFSIFEFMSLSSLFKDSDNVMVYNLVAPFGPLWIAQQVILFIASLILGRWVFGYLLKRLQTQLFMIFTTSVLAIFLVTTITFTSLLLKNLEDETARQLETDVKVLNYAIESKKSESMSTAQIVAQDQQVQQAVIDQTKSALYTTAQNILLNKKQSFLVILNDNGQVMARGEDKERTGDSLSDDPLVKRSLLGEAASSVVSKDGVLSPEVSVRSATPIKVGSKIIGAVMTGMVVDNAFVDGIKSATGLQTAIYGDNQLSATTLVASDGRSRSVGIKEENTTIKTKVLGKGESFVGPINILNSPYFAAYLPLKDVDSNPVGMLFVGKPQITVLQTAGRSIELTFVVTVILLVLSIIPAYGISRFISGQIR